MPEDEAVVGVNAGSLSILNQSLSNCFKTKLHVHMMPLLKYYFSIFGLIHWYEVPIFFQTMYFEVQNVFLSQVDKSSVAA